MAHAVQKRLVQQAFKFELDPNEAQRVLLAKSVGASRYVYNWGLAESQREYELTGKRPRLRELKRRLVQLKKLECPWLYEVSAHIGQQALADLNRAFERFFEGLKGEGPKSGFPRFKRKGERDSCRLYEFELSERHVRLPNVGHVRLKERLSERGFEGRPLSATITRRADRWFVSVAVECEREIILPRPVDPVARPTEIVGVDLGLRNAAVTHDGTSARVVEPSKALHRSLKKLKRLDRGLSRKRRGSRNREKAKLRRARLHYKVSCQRADFLNKLSSELARTKSVIVLEDLYVSGMQRNRHLAPSLADAGFGELRRQLAYKCDWYGSRLLVADRFFPSTKLCSSCATLNDELRGFEGLKTRQFDCAACGLSLDRDENAAINLRRFGLNVLNGELGIDPLPEGLRDVKPVSSALRGAGGELSELAGEEGSGSSSIGVKPASVKQEAKAHRPRWRDPQMRGATLAGGTLK